MLRENRMRTKGEWKKALKGFTLVELIVVITILAILATVGFLSLSGYSDDARTATVKANVRTVYSAILTESTTSGNSPRYYVSHDATAALSGAFVFVDGKSVALTGGDLGVGDSNYTAGNPRWDRLRMNGDKFRLSSGAGASGLPNAFGRSDGFAIDAGAAYSTGELAVGAVDVLKTGTNGRKRATPYFQVAGVVPGSKTVTVSGNLPGGTAGGLIRDPGSFDPAYSLADGIPSTSPIPESCKAAKAANPGAIDGTYRIDTDGAWPNPPFWAYCDMTTDGGGWTLVIKADGYSANFTYDSAYWTNTWVLNPDGYGFDTSAEQKNLAFSTLPFSSVMLGMNTSGTYRTIIIPKTADSLYSVFSGSVYQPTSLGRTSWKSIIPNSSLQLNCNREGFNIGLAGSRVRLGYQANQENDCGTPDSRIGIGGDLTYYPNSVGNATGSTGNDNGVVDIRSFGFLFVR